jgi:hypothetical protein
MGGSVTAFDATHAFLGVGDATGIFYSTQNNLQASSNKLRGPMDNTYPQQSTNTLTYQTTFGTTSGNFDWNEWGLFNNSGSFGIMLCRKVQSLGTKTSAQAWTLQIGLTINNP